MKKILGEAKNVRELLSSGKYSIEYYQREYKWEKKQIIELVSDLTSRFLDDYEATDERGDTDRYDHYFLGSIVVSNSDDGVPRNIVDGQQRLTSLTLLLIFLNNLQRDQTERAQIDQLIYSERHGIMSFNIDVPERKDTMQALYEGKRETLNVENSTDSVKNLVDRYDDIEDCFPIGIQGKALACFIDWLLDNVHLVRISAASEDDAYIVFETMNDRGLSLSPVDHLKGYLLANMAESDRGKANDLWRSRVQDIAKIEKDADSDFFKAWLRSQYANTIRRREKGASPMDFERIGSEFHRWVRDSKSLIGLNREQDFKNLIMNNFDFFSRQYLRLLKVSSEYTVGLEHVYYIAQSGFTLQPMLLLAPLSVSDSEEEVNRKWQVVSKYLDISLTRRIWNYKSVDQSTMRDPTFQAVLAIRGRDSVSMANYLKDELNKQAESFAGNETLALHGTNRKSIRRILARLTQFVEVSSGLADNYKVYIGRGGQKAYEVEHIWEDKHERFKSEFEYERDFKDFRNRIGGLLILPKQFNASYGALPYKDKLPHYNSQNLLVRTLCSEAYTHNPGFLKFKSDEGLPFRTHPTFTKQDLDERGALYRLLAEKVWNPENLVDSSS